MDKYKLTEETITAPGGAVLHRIQAIVDFKLADGTTVPAGALGGWVENEGNLSQTGKAWVYGDARVYGKACVSGDAMVYGGAEVYDDARVYDNARVDGNARVYDKAAVYGSAQVYGSASVNGDARVIDEAQVSEHAMVCGNALVYGRASICGEAQVKDTNDYSVFKNAWSSGRWFTYTRSNGMWAVGCFRGTGDELIAKAYKDSELSGKCYEAIVRAQEAVDRELNAHAENDGGMDDPK